MSHTYRFLGKAQSETEWVLTGDEAHHFAKVLRLAIDEIVEVTDGGGRWISGTVTAVTSREVTIRVSQSHQVAPPIIRLELAVGALRHGTVDEILPMLCELGVDRIHVFGQYGVAKSRLGPKVHERWHRILVQSIKQCKRPWLPSVEEHESVDALLTATAGLNGADVARFYLDPAATLLMPKALQACGTSHVLAIVGGEKGFDPREEAALNEAQVTGVQLGSSILRAVTAAVAAVTCLELHRRQL
ncbi:MAG: 16S rRNA (uracil(1498)-N(3))-methyltransferase [Deltaproteobacteria bacterium]|nr:16S rRNA (uracil(1498)-N(3))-methyltransferase [Deltaproteobacteria bacterium]